MAKPVVKKKVVTSKERPEIKRKFQGKKVSGGQKAYRKWSQWEAGDVLIGKYMGSEPDAKYGGLNRIIEVEEANFFDSEGNSLVGAQLSLNKNATLDRVFKKHDPKVGTEMQFNYNGKVEMTGGDYAGGEKHDIEILLASDDESEEGKADGDEEETEEQDDGYF